jgi:stage III sporulation protein AH
MIDNDNDNKWDFYYGFRTDRQNTYVATLKYLNEIIDSPKSSAEAKAESKKQKLKLENTMVLEPALEELIKSKGFEDCIVSLYTKTINLIVKKERILNDDD